MVTIRLIDLGYDDSSYCYFEPRHTRLCDNSLDDFDCVTSPSYMCFSSGAQVLHQRAKEPGLNVVNCLASPHDMAKRYMMLSYCRVQKPQDNFYACSLFLPDNNPFALGPGVTHNFCEYFPDEDDDSIRQKICRTVTTLAKTVADQQWNLMQEISKLKNSLIV